MYILRFKEEYSHYPTERALRHAYSNRICIFVFVPNKWAMREIGIVLGLDKPFMSRNIQRLTFRFLVYVCVDMKSSNYLLVVDEVVCVMASSLM